MSKYTRMPGHDHYGDRAFLVGGSGVRTLHDIMEWDHIIEVHADGSVSDDLTEWRLANGTLHSDMWVPELNDGELANYLGAVPWTLMGESFQMGGGHIMHDSEFVGGRLADEILETPGYYVVIESHHSCNEECDESCEEGPDGWAVAWRLTT